MEDNKPRNQILLVLFIGVLMGALDIAIVVPALPALQAAFGVGDRLLAWTFTIYVLFNLISTPLMAKLSDILGRRTIIGVSILVSYACYMLVIFWATQVPLLGMLMIPKMMAYLAVAFLAYRELYSESTSMATATA